MSKALLSIFSLLLVLVILLFSFGIEINSPKEALNIAYSNLSKIQAVFQRIATSTNFISSLFNTKASVDLPDHYSNNIDAYYYQLNDLTYEQRLFAYISDINTVLLYWNGYEGITKNIAMKCYSRIEKAGLYTDTGEKISPFSLLYFGKKIYRNYQWNNQGYLEEYRKILNYYLDYTVLAQTYLTASDLTGNGAYAYLFED